MTRKLMKARALLLLAGLVGLGALTPGVAHASLTKDKSGLASAAARWGCLRLKGPKWLCNVVAIIVDPVSPSVTGFALSMQYDPAKYAFNPSRSGPLCQFAQSGDCPPLDPLPGTQPVQLLPSTGYTPGATLPGSSLSMADAGSQVNVIYSLETGVSVPTDANIFLLMFDLVHPVVFDENTASVTYGSPGVGIAAGEPDFEQKTFFCTTNPPGGNCSSNTPVTTITTTGFTSTPEPSSVMLLASGVAALVGAGAVRRRCAA
jgi:hypothetical protein